MSLLGQIEIGPLYDGLQTDCFVHINILQTSERVILKISIWLFKLSIMIYWVTIGKLVWNETRICDDFEKTNPMNNRAGYNFVKFLHLQFFATVNGTISSCTIHVLPAYRYICFTNVPEAHCKWCVFEVQATYGGQHKLRTRGPLLRKVAPMW